MQKWQSMQHNPNSLYTFLLVIISIRDGICFIAIAIVEY